MNRSWLTSLALFLSGVSAVLLMFGGYWVVVSPRPPALTFDSNEISLGDRALGSTVPCEIRFRNTGRHPIHLDSVEAGCSCADVRYPTEPISPGQSAVIHLSIRVDRSGSFRLEPRIRIAGTEEPLSVSIAYQGIAPLASVEPVVYASRLVTDGVQEIMLKWKWRAPSPTVRDGWIVRTDADFLHLGTPRLTNTADSAAQIEVLATVSGGGAPPGLFRKSVRLSHDSLPNLESQVLIVGMAEDDRLVFEPPSVLLGRVSQRSTFDTSVEVRLFSGQPFRIVQTSASGESLRVSSNEGSAASHRLTLTVDPRTIASTEPWSAVVRVGTSENIQGALKVYGVTSVSDLPQVQRVATR